MKTILLISMSIALSVCAPIDKFDIKKTFVEKDDKIQTKAGKVIAIIEKNAKPNNDESTLVVSEEIIFSSTGYPTFDAFDHNSDGYIEFEEFAASDGKDHKTNFQRADTDGDLKLTPEEFSRLPLVVYEPEQFSDSDDEPPVVFLTPPESISRYTEKEVSSRSDDDFDEGKDITDSPTKEESKDNEEPAEETKSTDESTKTVPEKEKFETKNTENTENTESKSDDGTHFTAEDMPVKIDDEDDEDMIEMKDEDIPMEFGDDLNDDNHYDIDENREPHEDDKQMNDQLNSIE